MSFIENAETDTLMEFGDLNLDSIPELLIFSAACS